MAAAPRIPWYRKKRWWALIVAVLAVVALSFAFDPLVDYVARKELGKVKGYDITLGHAKLHLLKANVELFKLKIMKKEAGGEKQPFVYVRELEAGINARELLHGHLVARVDAVAPKVNLIAAKKKEDAQLDELPDLAKQLNALMPLRIDRVEVRQGELTFIDKTQPEAPRIWVHDADATVENLSTRAALAHGEPTVVALSGKLQKSGELSVWISADPLAKGLWFSGQAKAVGLDMKDFHDLIASRSGLALGEGTLDVFAEFDCRGDHITGGVKPVLKNPKVIQAKPGVENWVKKVFADAAVNILSDRVQGRNAVATTIPIDGHITQPNVQLWPTVFGVLRNAFVTGVTESYERLPPPEASGKQNIIEQAADALNKKKGPKAQPDDARAGRRKP